MAIIASAATKPFESQEQGKGEGSRWCEWAAARESQLPDQLLAFFNRGLKQLLLEWIHSRSIEAA